MTPEQQALVMTGYGHGVASSVFSPIALAFVLIAGILIWALPRNKAIIPFFLAAILIPTNQILVLVGLHFEMLKILALFGMIQVVWVRITGKQTIFSGGMNGLDVAMIVLVVFMAVNGVLLWRAWGEVIFELGQLYTPFGIYFLMRFIIRDQDDVKRTLQVWAWVAGVIAAVMICEQLTGRNFVYELLGGNFANDLAISAVRGNGTRAQGPFAHAILAGAFGGMSFPLFVGLWWKYKEHRICAAFGAVASVIIALSANSSTSYFCFFAGVFALCCWPLRKYMRPIRWGIVAMIVSLHIYMKAPVWALIGRINLTGDSSTWHREELVNQCIIHFWNWALIGTKDYGTWGWDSWDLSNQYVSTADIGGLIPLISFLAILVFAYKYLGKARRAAEGDRKNEVFIWALCATLFANTIAMIGISYFDQTMVAWYAVLAIISAATLPARVTQREPEPASVATAKPNLTVNPWLASYSIPKQRSK